ncbi:MAG: tRNA (guanosine(37)-N1)-methyltransferase TrmD [Candidatus Electrothrix aestuarii]|uniref:tRNA (guanine-N(1)-)-methyltransferase n=1 Tax=Candidatus Electrothrix aestuarii TaxID=3062594 RepID=A0AAU8LPH1_9BACT|nr:tRNA (guanosine(37)-N1)-methyltransferase TrmD [Candidatus Electrothrix aestuarii]
MRFEILTIFPDLFTSPLQEGILKRAIQAGQIRVNLHNIRDWATDKHAMTDDRPFGGGEGMVMKPEPLAACLQDVQADTPGTVVLLSPRGSVYTQNTAERLAGLEKLILVCGRYEGVDERFRGLYVDEELSIGDYILTGGELAAMVLIDSVTRVLPGVLGCADSATKDTFSCGLLKHGQYTRPREFAGLAVPDVLLSGDHARIEEYRFLNSVRETLQRRPELLCQVEFSKAEKKQLRRAGLFEQVQQAKNGAGTPQNN